MTRRGEDNSSRLENFTRDGQRFEEARRARFNNRFENRFKSLESETDPPDLEGSTRLSDVPLSRFELRNLFREQQEHRVEQARQGFAGALELADNRIQSVQLDDRGEQIGFVPDEKGRQTLAERFASDSPFVEPGDTLVDADPVEGVRTRTDPDALDTIASRAQQQFADDDPFAEPGDFGVDVGPAGVEDARLTDSGAQRRAGRQFESETPLMDVDPTADVRAVDDGFGLTTSAQRRLSARQFEEQFDQFGTGTLDPMSDVREVDGTFGLSRGPARQVAADDIDSQIPEVDIGPGDITLEETSDGGFEAIFEREI